MAHVSSRRRWPARIAGLLGTAGLLGAAVAVALMVMPSGEDEVAIPSAPAAASEEQTAAKKPRKPRLTKAQRRARQAAVDELTVVGYEPVRLSDYDPEARLRVLLGRADDGTRRAFFFVGRRFVGYDSDTPSRRLRVVRSGNRAVTLRYGLAGGGADRVRFRWADGALTPQGEIPPPELRAQAG